MNLASARVVDLRAEESIPARQRSLLVDGGLSAGCSHDPAVCIEMDKDLKIRSEAPKEGVAKVPAEPAVVVEA